MFLCLYIIYNIRFWIEYKININFKNTGAVMSVNFVKDEVVISSYPAVSGMSITNEEYDYVVIAEGGIVVDTTVENGGKMYVQTSGSANQITVRDGGFISLQNKAVVTDLTVEKGGMVGGFSFGTDSYWTNAPGGALAIGSKIIVSSTDTAESVMEVFRGASAVDITAENATIKQAKESELSNTVINHGGKYYVEGNTVNAAVNNSGYVEIKENGNAAGMTVNSGGSAAVFGNAANVNVNSGGHFGGYTFNADVKIAKIENGSGYFEDPNITIEYRKDEQTYDLTIGSGAELNCINAYNGDIYVDGKASDVTIAESFILYVNSTGKVSGVSNNGNMLVISGGSAVAVTNDNVFYLDGKASNVTNNSSMFVDTNGEVSDLINNAAAVILGSANNVTNKSELLVSSGAVVSNLVNSGNASLAGTVTGGSNFSSMTVAKGGVVNSFENAGNMIIFGSASDFTNRNSATVAGDAEKVTNSGELLVMAQGTVSDLTNTGKVELAGSAENVINSGSMNVLKTGFVAGMTNDGTVDFAGNAENVTNNATMNVGASVELTSVTNNNGTLTMANNVIVSGLIVRGGDVTVADNAVLNNDIVVAGGTLNVANNAEINNITVSNGIADIGENAKLTSTTIVNGGELSFGKNADLADLQVTGGTLTFTNGGNFGSGTVDNGSLRLYGKVTADSLTVNSGAVHVSFETAIGSLTVAKGVDFNGFIFQLPEGQTNFIEDAVIVNGVININENMTITDDRLVVKGNGVYIDGLQVTSGYFYLEDNAAARNIKLANVMHASNMAWVTGLDISSGGVLYVNNASATEFKAFDGAVIYAENGALIREAEITSGAKLYLTSTYEMSEITSDVFIQDNGILYIESGAKAIGIIINNGILNMTVAQNTLVNGRMEYGDFSQRFDLKDGKISGFEVTESSVLNVASDGIASNIKIHNGGALYVHSGIIYDQVNNSSGGIANNTIVSSGGYLHVLGSASAVNVDAGGNVIVSEGGKAENTVVASGSGGTLHVLSDGSAVSNTISSGAIFNVEGNVSDTEVMRGGMMAVQSTGSAFKTLLYGGSDFDVYGKITSTTAASRSINLFSGASASETAITSGTMTVDAGATANSNIIEEGAILNVSGSVSETTVASAQMVVFEGGSAESNTISRGASLDVAGFTSSTTVLTGGQMTVQETGKAYNNTISSGASLDVSGYTSDTNVLSSGTMIVRSSGFAENTTLAKGSAFDVYGGISATNATSRSINLYTGALATDTTINKGNMTLDTEAVAIDTEITDGDMTLGENAAARDTIIDTGDMTLASGATATNTTIANGDMTLAENATARDTIIDKGDMTLASGAAAMNTEITSGTMTVAVGATANTNIINNNAGLQVEGSATDTTVENGGWVNVKGGSITNTTINAGAAVNVEGGSAVNTDVYGSFIFDAASTIDQTTVHFDASITVDGVISNTAIKHGGTMTVKAGATHKGSLYLEDDVTINGTLDFTLTEIDHADTEYRVNDLSQVGGNTTYTITIQEGQFGEYELAQNASKIVDKNITVNVIGEESTNSFTLTANGERYFYENNGSYYELDLSNSGDLTLTVQMPEPIFSPSTLEPTKDNVYLTVIYPMNVIADKEVDNKYYRVKGTEEWIAYTGPIEVTDNETYEFYAEDGGFKSHISEYTVSNIDRNAPEIVSVNGNFEDYGNKDLLLYVNVNEQSPYTIEYSYDNGISWDTMKANSLTVGTGINYVSFRVTDKAGNVTLHTEQFTKENDNPTVRIYYNTEWTNKDIVITKTNDDKLLYSYDYTAENAANAVWYEFTGDLTIEDVTTLYFKAVDQWGNESDVENVVIYKFDRVKPTLTINDYDKNWTTENLEIKITPSDDVSDIDYNSFQYSVDGGMTWNVVDKKGSITVEQNCDLIVKVSDNAGNETISYVPITNIDKELPTVSVSYNEDWAQKVTVTIDASDSISDIALMEYTIDGGISWNVTDKEFSITDNSTVSVRVTDRAGNQTLRENIEITNIDNIAPEISIAGYDPEQKYEQVEITITATDEGGSGINADSFEYTINGINWFKVSDNMIIIDKNCTLMVRVEDNAGNFDQKEIVIDNIEKLVVPKNDIYQAKAFIGASSDISRIKDVYSYKPTEKTTVTASSETYKKTVTVKGSIEINKKDTEDIEFYHYSKVDIKNGADVAWVEGGKYSETVVEKLNKKNELTETEKISQSAAGTVNIYNSNVDEIKNYATVMIDDGSVGNLEIANKSYSSSEMSINGITQNSSYTDTRSASGKVTLKNGASADNIVNYKTVKLEDSTAGDVSLEAYTEKYSNKNGNQTTVLTTNRTGSFTAAASAVGNISGYKTVKLTDTVVGGDVTISDVAKNNNGVVTKKLTGTLNMTNSVIGGKVENYQKLTLSGSSVANVSNVQNIVVSKGFNSIGNYVGTIGNDTLTVNKNAVLTLNSADFSYGIDKLVLNGTLVLGSAFEINAETVSGKGEIVASSDVWNNIEDTRFRKMVLNLGATAENFVSRSFELADNTQQKAYKWDLKSDYNGWMSDNGDILDTVDYIKFKTGKEDQMLRISGIGHENITFLDKKGNIVDVDFGFIDGDFVAELSAKTDYTLKLNIADESDSVKYTVSIA